MKVIVGLGNPGVEHSKNRHNVGFMVVDRLAGEAASWESKFNSLILKSADRLLVKPQTFMNRSGDVMAEIVSFYKVSMADLVVIHDDLDIRLGEFKVVQGVGPKIHNGLISIEDSLGKKDFWRVRIGVDNRSSEARAPGDEYVLANFLPEEDKVIGDVIEKAVREIIRL